MKEETKENLISKTEIRYAVHMLITVVFAAIIAWFSNEIILGNGWSGIYFLFATALCAVIALCCFIERKVLYDSFKTLGILISCFIVSGLLLLLSDFYINLPVWLVGGIVTAALVNRNVGMLYLYYFVFHAIYLQENWMNGLVFHFVVASLIAFFIPKMKTFLSMLYMMAFAACIILTGSIIHNHMAIDGGMLLDTFYILCTYLLCILIAMLLVKWSADQEPGTEYVYLELLAEDTAKKDEVAEIEALERLREQEIEEAAAEESVIVEEAVTEEVITEEVITEEAITEEAITEEAMPEEAAIEEVITEETAAEETATEQEDITEEESEALEMTEIIAEEPIDYTPYCNEKAELLQELRAKDKASYARAILVGKLASTTAESMGLNKDLTKAAGLYKFIGKIRENSDEYTATAIAKEHDFPEPLIYLLDQLNHNIVEQKEAAVILITYGVISNYSIVRAAQKDVTVEKIVDTVVSKKIFQGEFNESGLNVQECFILREKLIDLLKAQDKKQAVKQSERKNV